MSAFGKVRIKFWKGRIRPMKRMNYVDADPSGTDQCKCELPRDRPVLRIHQDSWELLSEKSIGGEEVIMLIPAPEVTNVRVASDVDEVKKMLEGGLSIADAALPRTIPPALGQLTLDLSE